MKTKLNAMYIALSLALLSSCNYQENEVVREQYKNIPGSLVHKNNLSESMFLYDISGNGKVDLIRYENERNFSKKIVGIDSTLFADGFKSGEIHRTIYLSEEMSYLATKITKLQRELHFKIDSTYATKNFLPHTK